MGNFEVFWLGMAAASMELFLGEISEEELRAKMTDCNVVGAEQDDTIACINEMIKLHRRYAKGINLVS